MQKRFLGNSGIAVSVVGLGTVKFGRNQGVKYPTAFELPSDQQILQLLSVAKELGINLLDTAPAYGTSEERLGQLLKVKGSRQDWVISTKVGEECVNGESTFDFSAPTIEKSIKRSLQRLATDYLDIVLVHSNGDDKKIIEQDNVFASLEKLKQSGLIRAYGMSTKTVLGGLLAVDHSDVVMVAYHPGYTEEHDVITYAHQQNKGVFIKKALASGHLNLLSADNPIKTAMTFALNEPGVSSIIVGTLNPNHLAENASFASLTKVDTFSFIK